MEQRTVTDILHPTGGVRRNHRFVESTGWRLVSRSRLALPACDIHNYLSYPATNVGWMDKSNNLQVKIMGCDQMPKVAIYHALRRCNKQENKKEKK